MLFRVLSSIREIHYAVILLLSNETKCAAWRKMETEQLRLPRHSPRLAFALPAPTAAFAQTITQLQRQLGVRAPRPRVRQHDGLLPNEWWPTELVRTLFIPRGSLYHWIRQGLVRARQLDEPLHRWVAWADEAEQERLREYHRRAIGDDLRHRWTDAPLAEQL
jgi:hypothetical protein